MQSSTLTIILNGEKVDPYALNVRKISVIKGIQKIAPRINLYISMENSKEFICYVINNNIK